MKKLILNLIIAFNVLAISSCFSTNDEKPSYDYEANVLENNETIKVDNQEKIGIGKVLIKSKAATVNEEDFQQMVKFIQKKGVSVSEINTNCNYQYAFIDKNENLHIMKVVNHDQIGNSPIKGSVNQISVYFYYSSIEEQDRFFEYNINKKSGMTFVTNISHFKKDITAAKLGSQEFINKIK